MKNIVFKLWLFGCLMLATGVQLAPVKPDKVLLKNVTLIDGTGMPAKNNMDILLQGDRIVSITPTGRIKSGGARVIDLQGKTIMPALICAHAHVGVLKGTTIEASNYTRDNLIAQLKRYERYGVGTVLCMGTDRSLIFHGFRDSSRAGLLPGARLYSAGHGFSTPGGPPGGSWTDELYRPANAGQVAAEMDSLALLRPDVVKVWVDDFGGHSEKMKPEIYQAIIREAHKRGLRVAAHLFYLEDARRLVHAGLDIIAHSIRDQEIDEALLKKMKENGVIYIPTLTRDEFTYVYADNPSWMGEGFFKAALEPGVYEMISSKGYQDKIRNSPDYQKNKRAVQIALINLKKISDAGILVALGTDSGADPVRAQGFSEHRELELMVSAGLTPLQAIEAGTKNAAIALKINQRGTLEPGKQADFVVLSKNPEREIKNTRTIEAVWKNGVEVR